MNDYKPEKQENTILDLLKPNPLHVFYSLILQNLLNNIALK